MIHNAARVRRMLREAEQRGVLACPPGLQCVARLGKHAVRVICGRPARYLTDEFRVPVCGLHHPRLLAERLLGE